MLGGAIGGGSLRASIILLCIAASSAACNPPTAAPSANLDVTGILLVGVGERVQGAPASEEFAVAHSNATLLAEGFGDDLGYPWLDPSGQLVLSVVTPRGRDLVESADFGVPYRIREVAHGAADLDRIRDDATRFRSQGVPGAEFIYATIPDHRDNRALIVISEMNRPLLDYLAEHYPVDAIAIQVDPGLVPAGAP